jgi:hypothetical protein
LWSPDGKQIFYVKPDTNLLFAADVRTQPAFAVVKTTQLSIAGTIQPGPPSARNYDITRDGKQFIVVVPGPNSQAKGSPQPPPQMNFVVNWFTELQQRVPVRGQ